MFDHVGLKVADLERSVAFWRAVSEALGMGLQSQGDGYAGFGPKGAAALWLHAYAEKPLGPGAHVALKAPDRNAVHAFHAAGLAAGGRDNGPPGPRAEYSADYYAAFLLDPDGHNVEAVCYG